MAIINQITFKNGIDANNAKRYLVKYSFDNLTKSGDTVTWGSDYEASNIEVEDLADDLKLKMFYTYADEDNHNYCGYMMYDRGELAESSTFEDADKVQFLQICNYMGLDIADSYYDDYSNSDIGADILQDKADDFLLG